MLHSHPNLSNSNVFRILVKWKVPKVTTKLKSDLILLQQEQVQKFLQLQQSPSLAQDVEHKQEPKRDASSSSPQQETPSSSSPFPPSSSASSFTVHYLPTPSDPGISSDVNSKDKSENDLCAEKSTSDATRQQARPNADEIELTSTTTGEERRFVIIIECHSSDC